MALLSIHPDISSAQPPINCECFADYDVTTNCIETKLVPNPVSPGCYTLVVYNHQWDQDDVSPCSMYGAERYLTFELKDRGCWEGNGVNLQVTPLTFNGSYSPPQSSWYWDSAGTQFGTYDYSTGHLTKFTFQRRNNSSGSQSPMGRCAVDSFRICVGCVDNLNAPCVEEMEIDVYFSDINGNATCVNEVVPGRTYERLAVRPPLCPSEEVCDTACDLYLSPCNSLDVQWGCDYADVTIINDHGWPECGPISSFEIGFSADGLGLCEDNVETETVPTFRNWTTTRDTSTGELTFTAPSGCALMPCDTFRVRIPFCCDSIRNVGLVFGQGLCVPYDEYWVDSTFVDSTSSWDYDTNYVHGNGDAGITMQNRFADSLECAGCFFDQDEATLKQGMVCILDTVPLGICDEWVENSNVCDELTIYNRNHSPMAIPGCGSDPTGNQPIASIELTFDHTVDHECTPSIIGGPPATESFPGSGVWTFIPSPPIAPCDFATILVCCYEGPITWKTFNASSVVITTDSVKGRWPDDCEPGSSIHVEPPTLQAPLLTEERLTIDVFRLSRGVPNPTTGIVTLTFESERDVTDAFVAVYDVSGALVYSRTEHVHAQGRHDIELDGSDWKSGLYHVRVTVEDSQLMTSFVVRK